MSELVERVAKAIFMSQYLVEESDWPDRVQFCCSHDANAFRDSAKAAIEAMREPTDEMIDAVGSDWGSHLKDNWETMIDEALK